MSANGPDVTNTTTAPVTPVPTPATTTKEPTTTPVVTTTTPPPTTTLATTTVAPITSTTPPATTTPTPTTTEPATTSPKTTEAPGTSPTTTTKTPVPSTTKSDDVATTPVVTKATNPPPSTTNSPSSDSNGMSTGTYAAIGGGAVFIVGLVACLIVVLRRRKMDDDAESNHHPSVHSYYDDAASRNTAGSRKSLRYTQTPTTARQSAENQYYSGPGARRNTGGAPNTQGSTGPSTLGSYHGPEAGEVNEIAGYDIRFDKSMSNFRVANDEVEVGELIASGGFGIIYRGRFGGEDIAIKKCLPDKVNNHAAMESFMLEIKLMSKLDHPNIVRFVGVAWTTLVQLKMLTEFMPRGNVRMLLQNVKKNSLDLPWIQGPAGISRLRIAANVAEALVYLHSNDPPIIHRDLKSSNVLLSNQYDAKLTDFGTSREMSDENTMTAEIGTLAWIAPEIMLGGHYTERADIYSFGVLLNELDLCDLPYSNVVDNKGASISHTRLGVLVAQNKVAPQFTGQCPNWIAQMGLECLRFDPLSRPTAMQLAYRMRRVIADAQ
ncbi:Aste57867_23426 [Aphanomyces stellatus]|uniref:Aste57867_23426 protein n=1 Tax=Aphanomyces stellatus TaxID=120398 RepID=A0A485LMQ3_9STRA|nr:hypothetical protein As57867_023355 [Aphanomyces stellatus]VFU00072.1 Aste57867_23426 [Aphanomyces stellatus]